MPDLATLLNTTSPALLHSSNLKHPPSDSHDPIPTNPISTPPSSLADSFRNDTASVCNEFSVPKDPRRAGAADRTRKAPANKNLDDHVKASTEKKVDSGASPPRCFLPFLVNAPRMVECLVCRSFIYPGEEIMCSVRRCQGVYHLKCAKEKLGFSLSRKFKCPQHVCFICKQKSHWRCVRCTIASHDKCAAWPDKVINLGCQAGKAICWRHSADWRLETKD